MVFIGIPALERKVDGLTNHRNVPVLCLSYDGLLEPLGRSQVWSYLKHLAADYEIFLVTFEKRKDWLSHWEREKLRKEVAETGVHWAPLRYHKAPIVPATVFDLICGFFVCLYFILSKKIRIIHARSYVMAVLALVFKKILKTKFIFDMRGFWADERIEGGIWPKKSILFKVAKHYEKVFLTNADMIVSLTESGVDKLKNFPYLKNRCFQAVVIPTCVDSELFSCNVLPSGRDKPFVLGYLGTVSGWYSLKPVLECFKLLNEIKADSRLLIINRGEHSYIRSCLEKYGIDDGKVEIKALPYEEIPKDLCRMDAGIFFINPTFSKSGSSPTKVGEFLACGKPFLSNFGIGDLNKIVTENKVGILLDSFDKEQMLQGIKRLLDLTQEPGIKERCVSAANRYFSLERGVGFYKAVYESLK